MALERAVSLFQMGTAAAYEAKKRKIFAEANPATERISNGMIYCRRCYSPKVADFPEYNYVTKCCCKCEVEAWEREMDRLKNPPRPKEVRNGDWNPFDGRRR